MNTKRVLININHIVTVTRTTDTACMIVLSDGNSVYVMESLATVKGKLVTAGKTAITFVNFKI